MWIEKHALKVCGLNIWHYVMSLIFVLYVFVEKLFSGNGCCTQYFVKKKKTNISLSELLTGPVAHERIKLFIKCLS